MLYDAVDCNKGGFGVEQDTILFEPTLISSPNAASAQSVVQSTNSSAVLFKHRVFKAAYQNAPSEFTLQLPEGSESFWSRIDSISLADTTGIRIESFTLHEFGNSSLHPNYGAVTLRFVGQYMGEYTLSGLTAVDASGQEWNVPFGRVDIAILENSVFAETSASSLMTCQSSFRTSTSTTAYPTSEGQVDRKTFEMLNTFLLDERQDNSAVWIWDSQWGSETFAELTFAEASWRTVNDDGGVTRSLSTPFPLSAHDAMQFDINLRDTPADDGAIWGLSPAIKISQRDDEGWIALDCGTFLFADLASEELNTFDASAVENAETASVEPPDNVMYKHKIYNAVNSGRLVSTFVEVPLESEDWWNSISHISMPELPSEISSDLTLGLSKDYGPRPELGVQRLVLNVDMRVPDGIAGVYDVTKLHVHNGAGNGWEVPIGLVQFDILKGSLAHNDGNAFSLCQSVDEVDALIQSGQFPADLPMSRVVNQRPYTIEVEEIHSPFMSTQLFVRADEGFELPQGNIVVESGEDVLFHIMTPNTQLPNTIQYSNARIGYRVPSSSTPDRMHHEAIRCGAYYETGNRSEELEPTLIKMPHVASTQSASTESNNSNTTVINPGEIIMLMCDQEDDQPLCALTPDQVLPVEVPLEDSDRLSVAKYTKSFNDSGTLVFECTDHNAEREIKICIATLGSDQFTIVPNIDTQNRFENRLQPSINRSGEIAFICEDQQTGARNLCMMHTNGTNLQVVLEDPTGDEFTHFAGPDINNVRQIVFGCFNEGEGGKLGFIDICLVNADGTGLRKLLDDSSEEMPNFNSPSINSAGQVVFLCRHKVDSGTKVGICGMNIFDDDYEIIYQAPNANNYVVAPDIDEDGRIVFNCVQVNSESGSGSETNVCAINFDGTGFEVLLDDVNGDAPPNYIMPKVAND